ncbi:MAG: metal ABC transporter permease [Gammaproteobacteria bacterium]|nr:MAG: metal ABC transporter permease [Gammaproteobacteria bacterium]RTZ61185.1 MAG: metal ABC transporter permease [Gammaproteobacteria bacterium]
MKPDHSVPRSDPTRSDWQTIHTLFPYLWSYRGRILAGLVFLIFAKLANVAVPITLKKVVDALSPDLSNPYIVLPLSLLIAYGSLRFLTILFNELRNLVFARASEHTIRALALRVFDHLHTLSLRFHLDRQTGGLSRDVERGTRSISLIMRYLVFNIIPTFFEIAVVTVILLINFRPAFAIVTLIIVAVYSVFTLVVTNWRTRFRVEMNRSESSANTKAIDALINYETVKYFGNEQFEAQRYDQALSHWEDASIKSLTSLAFLNVGQGAIIAIGLTILLVMAGQSVSSGEISLGDFVMINAFLIQLYIPLNFLGSVFRELKHSLVDLQRMFDLLEEPTEIMEKPDARPLVVDKGEVRYEHVDFAYNPDRQILFDVTFTIPAGKKVAVVGTSGSGKSTLARLLFRFYEVTNGCICIDGQDIRDVTLDSLRAAIGIVPQDTVLFNNTIGYNIRYGKPDASDEDIIRAAKLAHIHHFIEALPRGYDTMVGERGLKLSGGEKQRVAIARTILKNPKILIFDEATSALDSHSEKAIQKALNEVAANRTTLVIAHRLSTVTDAHEILVMEHGRIVERGPHRALLAANGIYTQMWKLQLEENNLAAPESDQASETAKEADH